MRRDGPSVRCARCPPPRALDVMSCQSTTKSVTGQAQTRWDDCASDSHDEGAVALAERRGLAARRAGPHAGARGPVIDPLGLGQAWPVIAVHEGLSPTSRRLRYSAPTPRLTPGMVRVLIDLRPGNHEAYAAWRDGRPIGIVRWIRTTDLPDAAELALEVVDAEQGRGVGRALAAFAAVRACRAGVRTIVVSVDPDNVRVHAWLASLGAKALPEDAGRFAVPIQAVFAASPATDRNMTTDRSRWPSLAAARTTT
jgi:GNAT superfamily N-acetyltransferase